MVSHGRILSIKPICLDYNTLMLVVTAKYAHDLQNKSLNVSLKHIKTDHDLCGYASKYFRLSLNHLFNETAIPPR